MLKIPFQFVWNIQNFILSWKQSVWSKNGMFWGLFNLAKIAVSLTGVHFFVDFRIFWNVENTLPIRLKHSKFYSFMKNNQFGSKNGMFWGLFNFGQNRCIRTLPAWPFFWLIFGFFEILKIPFQFVWNIQNFILSWKQSVWSKNGMFWGLFKFGQNRCIPYRRGHFFGWF